MAFHGSPPNENWSLPPGDGLDLLIVGKTGTGKSSVGNSILGAEYFKVSFDTESETQNWCLGDVVIDGRHITVLDTPGLSDTADIDAMGSHGSNMDAFFEGLGMCPRGFNAILIVMQSGARMTQEELGAIQRVQEMLGDGAVSDYGVIVFTGGDSFDRRTKGRITFEEWCREQKGAMASILQQCQYRCVLFNNVTENKDVLARQRCRLVQLIDGLDFRGHIKPIESCMRFRENMRNKENIDRAYTEIGRMNFEISRTQNDGRSLEPVAVEEMNRRIEEVKITIEHVDEETNNKLSAQLDRISHQLSGRESDGVLSRITNWFCAAFSRIRNYCRYILIQ